MNRYFSIILVLLLIVGAAGAQTINLQHQADYPLGAGAATPRFAVGDLNRDGRPDLVTATGVSGQPVSVLLNNGSGGFAAPAPITTSFVASAVAIGDFNSDGNPDLAIGSTNNTTGVIGIRLGNGTGSFPNETSTSLVQAVTDISAADFNGDGNLDLVMTNSLGYAVQPTNAVRLILGNGSGSFGAPTNFAVGSQPLDIEVADFSNDGRPDVAAVAFSTTETFILLTNNGSGGFTPSPALPIGATASSSAKVVSMDFNRDCAADLAFSTSDSVFVLLNDNAGFFTGFSFSITNAGPFVPASLATGDFNLDRFPDIAIGRLNTSGGVSLNIIAGNGSGNFQAPITLYALSSSAITDQMIVLDAGLDGKADIALSRRSNSFALYSGSSPLIKRTVGDFDADGRSDLAVFRPAAGDWLIQRSMLGFQATHWGVSGDAVTPSDFDGDFKTDIAVWRQNGYGDPDRSYFFILRSSDGTFQQEQFGRAGDTPSVTGDWDGDGKADVAVFRDGENPAFPGSDPQARFYYRPSGTPGVNFAAVPWGSYLDRPVRGDFDGDGRIDPTVFRSNGETYYVLQSSNGQARYQKWGFSGDERIPADYDGDGKTDFAVTRANGDTPARRVWYILNSSTGTATIRQWGLASDTLVPGDYNADGRVEIGTYRGSDQRWYVPQCAVNPQITTKFGTAGDFPAFQYQN